MGAAEVLAIIAFPIAVIGSLFGVLAYIRPRKRQKLLYQTSGIQYFEEQEFALPSDFVMTFQGENVERLAKTTLILWNGGTDVLRGEDIIVDNPIRIRLPEERRILRNRLIGESGQSNRMRIEEILGKTNELAISYDYLNIDDGAVIEVMHDAKEHDPTIIGAAKGLSGGPKGLGNVTFHDIEKPERKRTRRALMIVMIAGIMSLTISGVSWVSRIPSWSAFGEVLPSVGSYSIVLVLGFLGLIYTIMPTYVFWKNRRRYPKSLRRFLQTQQTAAS